MSVLTNNYKLSRQRDYDAIEGKKICTIQEDYMKKYVKFDTDCALYNFVFKYVLPIMITNINYK